MIWSVDQDDAKFSALEGLTGHKVDEEERKKKSQITDTGHWASLNGQKCKLTPCSKDVPIRCEPGWAMPPGGQSIKDNCGDAGEKLVCCPVDSMPNKCQWRGGETGKVCHGQCHTGESTLFHSRDATVNCLRPGFQAFCCEATSFKEMIDVCKWTPCPGRGKAYKEPKCGPDTIQVANKYDRPGMSAISAVNPSCSIFTYHADCTDVGCAGMRGVDEPVVTKKEVEVLLCCPKEQAFDNCHWVGKGTCDDNECSA